MCNVSDHERIGPMLASFERASHLKQIEHEDAAERARDDRRSQEDLGQIGGREVGRPAAGHHERMARVHARRAEHARDGHLISGPDERTDAEHQRDDAELIRLAHRTGRVLWTDDTVD
jgi:hypothetical protein